MRPIAYKRLDITLSGILLASTQTRKRNAFLSKELFLQRTKTGLICCFFPFFVPTFIIQSRISLRAKFRNMRGYCTREIIVCMHWKSTLEEIIVRNILTLNNCLHIKSCKGNWIHQLCLFFPGASILARVILLLYYNFVLSLVIRSS
jgi:hypothetical protein